MLLVNTFLKTKKSSFFQFFFISENIWSQCRYILRMTFSNKSKKRISDSSLGRHQANLSVTQPVKNNFLERSFKMSVSVLVFCVLSFISSGSCFNVDVSSKVIHGAPRDSCDQECMFGFSVAQHRERGVPWYETF